MFLKNYSISFKIQLILCCAYLQDSFDSSCFKKYYCLKLQNSLLTDNLIINIDKINFSSWWSKINFEKGTKSCLYLRYYRNTLCHVPPYKIKIFNFFLAVVMFPSGFLTTDSDLLKDVWGFCFEFFFLPSKNHNKK